MIIITSGSYWKEEFKNKYRGILAFNEAMDRGTPDKIIFSEDFISERIETLGVSRELYMKKTIEELKPFISVKDEKIKLIFDDCSFCQINIITILGYLDFIGYKEKVELEYLTEKKQFIGNTMIDVEGYYKIYLDVLRKKKIIEIKGEEILNRGIRAYIEKLS